MVEQKPFFLPYQVDFYLMLTEACPLRCEYCYIKDRDNPTRMSRDTMDLMMKKVQTKPRIIFFGGEPLLGIVDIKWFTEKYEDDVKVFQIVTSTFPRANFHELIENVIKPSSKPWELQLSFDGFEGSERKLVNTDPVAQQVYENILYTLEQGIKLQVRCVINDSNIYYFHDTYKQFKRMSEEYSGLFYADFTLVHETNLDSDFPEVLKRELGMILDDILTDENPFITAGLASMIGSILEDRKCMACNVGSEIIIRPNGDIYPCTMLSQYSEDFKMGHITDRELNTDIATDVHERPADCDTCDYNKYCFGGCRYERSYLGNLNEINLGYCEQTKTVVEALLTFRDKLYSDSCKNRELIIERILRYRTWRSGMESTMDFEYMKFRGNQNAGIE